MPNRVERRRRAAIARASAKKTNGGANGPAVRAASVAPKLITATTSVEIKAAGDSSGAKRFAMTAYTGEPMDISGYDLPVVVDMQTLDTSIQRIPILYDHCPEVDYVVGQSDSIQNQDGKLTLLGPLYSVGQYAQKVQQLAANGHVWQASIGAQPKTLERVQEGANVTVNGRSYPGPCYVARGCVLREVSFVVIGGDRKTSAVIARRKTNFVKGAVMTFEEWLLKMGFEDPTALSEIQRANMQDVYNSEVGEDGTETPGEEEVVTPTNASAETPVDETQVAPTNAGARRVPIAGGNKPLDIVQQTRLQAAAEENRIASIRKIAASYGNPEITRKGSTVNLLTAAISEGWTANETELAALRNERQKSPHLVIRKEQGAASTLNALAGSIMLRAGLKIDSPQLKRIKGGADWFKLDINDPTRGRIMEASEEFSDMSLVDICAELLRIEGKQAPRNRLEMIRAATSGSSFASIFTTNVNAQLQISYMEAVDTTDGWTTTTEVADFKSNERIRVKTGEGLKKRPRGGEADHTSFGDALESYSIAHYSRQFVVDQIDIINDSLGAMADTPRKFGLAAARLRPDLVYSILLANPTLAQTARALFNATDGNTDSGALAAATLKTAIQSMFKQQENGVNLNVVATHLLVPPALKFTAYELLQSQSIVIAGTAGSVTERGTKNTLADEGINVVVDGRLENGLTSPDSGATVTGSASGWYLAANLMNTIEVAYLRGTGRAPQVRSWTYDKEGKYGVGWDVALSIGAAPLDWRGFWRRTG